MFFPYKQGQLYQEESQHSKLTANIETRKKTFIKAKLKKSDGSTNINKYTVAPHKTLQNIISEKMNSCKV